MSGALNPGQADRLLRSLVGAAKAQSLYPPGHTAVARALRALDRELAEALAPGEPLLLAKTPSHLLCGGVSWLPEDPVAGDLVRWFAARDVEAVEIGPGATGAEVGRFLAWLTGSDPAPWEGRHVRLTKVDEGGPWERGRRTYFEALDALEVAYREAQEGRIPDPERACRCVQSFVGILEDDPVVAQGLALLKSYDRYTFHHSVNVCLLALSLGQHLELGPEDLERLGVGALLHDIGKTRTPAEIVRKPGHLDPNEWAAMRRHPVLGRQLLEGMEGLPPGVARLVYEHHMHYDGGGYPDRPPGYRPDRMSPLVTVVDAYDAMTTHRPYSRPLPLPEAASQVQWLSGKNFDPDAVEAFRRAIGTVPVGSAVRLMSGEVAVVTRLTENGEVGEVCLVVDPTGRPLPPGEQAVRPITGREVVRWVDPLVHGIRPHEVLARIRR